MAVLGNEHNRHSASDSHCGCDYPSHPVSRPWQWQERAVTSRKVSLRGERALGLAQEKSPLPFLIS